MHNLSNIYCFRRVSDTIATAGQPLRDQFPAIQAAGFQIVMNLALPSSEGALADEQAIVEALGMKYIHIPVVWEHPTIEQVQQFFEVLNENASVPIFIHCAKNMRVAVFVYLYQRLYQQMSDEIAKAGLHQIWTPNAVWQHFIQTVLEMNRELLLSE